MAFHKSLAIILFLPALALANSPVLHATTLPPFDPYNESKLAPNAFGPYSATSLSSLRQRWNFNAIRIPLIEVPPQLATGYRQQLESFQQTARMLGLTPVLAGSAEDRFENIEDALPCPQPDPSELTGALQARLAEYDRRGLSWTASTFAPGRLITDYATQNATTLENGWSCGSGKQTQMPYPGIGLVIQTHLWNASIRGLYAVSAAGGQRLPRAGVAILYGPIFAQRDLSTPNGAKRSAGVRLEIVDRCLRRFSATLLYVSAGWGQANFIVPPEACAGPARLILHRFDGSIASANVEIVNTAPGMWTALTNGRGPAIAWAGSHPLWSCIDGVCRTVPVPVTQRTNVRVSASGLRYASKVRANFAGQEVQVVSVAPSTLPGAEDVVIALTTQHAQAGEADLVLFADAQPSNVVRLNVIPASLARVTMGRYLFYDIRLSVNGSVSCATCHRQELAFTDGRRTAQGATGQLHPRSSMSLVNVGRRNTLGWTNPAGHSLEAQALVPLTATAPVEMGANPESILALIRHDPHYRILFAAAFPAQAAPPSIANLTAAIAAFERTILSNSSEYETYRFGAGPHTISESAKRGELLFYSSPLAGCYRCHSGPDFTDGQFHNTGISSGTSKFLTPTLRNIAITGPYMHDGSIDSLAAVVDRYAGGGRHRSPELDPRMQPIPLSEQNRRDLVAFLSTLTDSNLLKTTALANPW